MNKGQQIDNNKKIKAGKDRKKKEKRHPEVGIKNR